MDDESKIYKVLFVSQRDRARSVMAAALMNSIGQGRFRALSAGVHPASEVDPVAVELLLHAGVPTPKGKPRSLDDLYGAPPDFVFALTDIDAGEPQFEWPGHSISGHWRCVDPARFDDNSMERRLALISARKEIERRLRTFANLPSQALDRSSLRHCAASLQ